MGAFTDNPSPAQMGALIDSLNHHDPEHPDVAVKHETEWCISVNAAGTVTFENAETGEGPWHMLGQSKEQVLALWELLAEGKLEALQKLPWKPGYAQL
jgi:hypothetical protein